MQLSPRTTQILKNFATINPGLIVRPGTTLKTMTPNRKVVCTATVAEQFEKPFAIADLGKFLGALSLFKEPQIAFFESYVSLQENDQTLHYGYGNIETIVPPVANINFPDVDLACKVPHTLLKHVLKAAAILAQPEIAIVGRGDKIYLETAFQKKPTNDLMNVPIEGTARQFPFKMIFKTDNLKILDLDYEVEISFQKISRWKAPGVEYIVVVESSSTVGS